MHTINPWSSAGVLLLFFASALSASAGPQSLADQSPQDLYRAIKSAVGETIRNEKAFSRLYSGEAYDLILCLDSTELGLAYDSPLFFPATIALHIEIYKRDLGKLGVPENVGEAAFASMDQVALSVLQDLRSLSRSQMDRAIERREAEYAAAQKRLLRDLNSYRNAKAGTLPPFTYEGGCGAGEVEVDITTTPGGATVSYIPAFSYKLCEARQINPEDPRRCDGWVTAVQVTENLAGKYYYVATWPDGKQKKGLFDVRAKTRINISQ